MKANMNTADKVSRITFAIVVAVLYITAVISGIAAIILSVVAAILVVTVFINFCPVYHFLGISTKKKTIQSHNK